ncbi:autophagy protein 16, interacts with Atg12p-Atg5p [Ophidiomyces ophidiicola]|uniref:Autophagy protein 16, interacts with Atg12p-Atg5p n=1 Tax=Ophidiomyces ophidiicola TaxID=1387563 RepID=A0ACB8UUM6_9EURO|nr:autophagy protein 16, interacts with Atg12p-Atg5p [Ophidiomyces ophidiicola]KAI1946905.1 autophagy protein 16, interacts with Atg12p-Atg5p [Ophidiomyces ophidiicola]KAI1971548.1 autophagy protein 16, interacts with Atg12p-Atg5p [Ophidiomyces ophidiicola]KAI2009313.1 autophagy protein 16, interacts with Atg12p-Atg5p [Ophidiomyces ophidiicola]KAI2009986.1 autophagy protein 16, interacts with Atg12p-Atg5p [Ophidiomyces ophidiicola]
MANWREEYYAALGVRDECEKSNKPLYDAYTRLADRTSNLEIRPSTVSAISPKKPSSKRDPLPISPSAAADTLSAARKDLAEAQRSRTELSSRLKKATDELETAKKKATVDTKKIIDISVERTQLQQRLRDRDEELRGKAKLLDDVQDELVSLNLQVNMSEDRAKRLEKENKELIDRWMAKVSREADAMNNGSKFS